MPTLTELSVRNAKPREKPYKLFDERRLFTRHARRGRLQGAAVAAAVRYRYRKVEKLLSLGSYPDVPLERLGRNGMRLGDCWRMGWIPVHSGRLIN